MLMKLSPGLYFTNMFMCSFYPQRSQKRKMTDDLTAFFVLLGSTHVKAARKMLVELTTAANLAKVHKTNSYVQLCIQGPYF